MRAQVLQENFDAIHAFLSGEIDSEALGDRAVSSNNIGLEEVKTDNIGAGSVTLPKLDTALVAAKQFLKNGSITDNQAFNSYTAGNWAVLAGMDFTVNPSVKSILHVSGMVAIQQVGSKTDVDLYAAVVEGGIGSAILEGEIWQPQSASGSGRYHSIPICGFIPVAANTTKTFKVCVKSSEDGAISIKGEGGRTNLSAILLPVA